MSQPPTANFNLGLRYRLGCGRRASLAREARSIGITSALVVTDAGVAALPWFEPMLATARENGLTLQVFADVRSNPSLANVMDGLTAYREGAHDGVVLVGGGSVMDTGKAIALMAGHPGSVFDYEFLDDKWRAIDGKKVAPMLAMPTTAGSGSEVSPGAVVTDGDAGVKRTLLHPALTPKAVIADPETTFALPPKLTAATGMDALTHCFEAYCSPMYHPIADAVALEGMRLLDQHLLTCYREPDNASARTQVMVAASMAAIAFQKGLGLVHAMVHPLGAVTDIHHGLGNAIVLPYVMKHNRDAIEPRMDLLARHLGLVPSGFEAVLAWVRRLQEALGIPPRLLGTAGIESTALAAELAPKAMAEKGYIPYNPKPVTVDEVRRLYEQAIAGEP